MSWARRKPTPRSVGIAMLTGALWFARRDLRRIRAGHVADARVIALIPVDSQDGVTFRTQVEFRDRKGVLYQVATSASEAPAPYEVGDLARVCYDPEDPGKGSLVRWPWLVSVGTMGLMATLVAALACWAAATGRLATGS
jgi:hypothetical protein